MATIPVVKEFQEPGVCNNVSHVTIDVNGMWVRSTAVGQKDEIINDYEMYQHITADVGAILEATPTGIRISPDAVDSALSGGGSTKLRVDIGKQPQKGIADTDKILFEDATGANFWTTRADVSTSGPIKAYSFWGNQTAGQAAARAVGQTDLTFFTPGSGAYTALAWNAVTGEMGQHSLATFLTGINFAVSAGSEYVDVTHDANGLGFTIPYATSVTAGVMRAVDYQKLESLSSGTVDLSSTFTVSSFTINSSTGSGTTIPSATLSTAGAMSANSARLVTKLAGGPGNALMVNYTNVGEAEWAQRDNFTLRSYTTGVRLVGFDSNGNLGAYNPDVSGGGGGAVENIVHLTAHSLTAADYTKLISSSGSVFDDTDPDDWPLGVLKDIIDANTVELYPPGYEMTLSSTLVDPTFNLATDGGWMSWDLSAGYYVATKPTDSIADLTEMVQITEATTGGYYAVIHDHGPLGASVSTPVEGGGGGTSDPEVVITSSTPSGLTVQTGEKFLVHTSLNDIYRANGSSWQIIEKSVVTAPDGSTSVNASGAKTIVFAYTSSAVVTGITNGRDGQQVTCIFLNGNAEVDDTGAITLAHGDIFSPGTNGGSLVLEYYSGNWYEISRTSYSPKTNIIAGYF